MQVTVAPVASPVPWNPNVVLAPAATRPFQWAFVTVSGDPLVDRPETVGAWWAGVRVGRGCSPPANAA